MSKAMNRFKVVSPATRVRGGRLGKNSAGFTVLELMIATMVFSMVLLLCAAAIVQVGRTYYKGLVVTRTEEASRRAIDDVTRSIQFGDSGSDSSFLTPGFNDTIVPGTKSMCLGTVRYTYAPPDLSLGGTGYSATAGTVAHALWKDHWVVSGGQCPPVDLTQITPSAGGTELLGDQMRVAEFSVVSNSVADLWKISLTISYGTGTGTGTPPDYGVFNDDQYNSCINNTEGGSFCAVSSLMTTVAKRL